MFRIPLATQASQFTIESPAELYENGADLLIEKSIKFCGQKRQQNGLKAENSHMNKQGAYRGYNQIEYVDCFTWFRKLGEIASAFDKNESMLVSYKILH